MKNLNLNIAPKLDKKYPYDYSHMRLGNMFMFEDLTTI